MALTTYEKLIHRIQAEGGPKDVRSYPFVMALSKLPFPEPLKAEVLAYRRTVSKPTRDKINLVLKSGTLEELMQLVRDMRVNRPLPKEQE